MLENVDWEALSAIAGGLVFTATAILAIATFRLARSARKQATAAEKQAEAATAQANASAELADIARRRLQVSSSAALGVIRVGDGKRVQAQLVGGSPEGSLWGDRPEWQLGIQNTGEATAMTEQAAVHVPGVGGRSGSLGAGSQRALEPNQPRTLRFSVTAEDAEKAGKGDGEWTVTVPYRERGSTDTRRFQAALKQKRDREAGSWRWVVVRERTK